MNIEVKEALDLIAEVISSGAKTGFDEDAVNEAWDIVKEKKNYGYGYDDTNSIAIIWEIDDIKNIRPDLTDDECMEVLGYADRKHDATLGITYDTLEWHCDYLFPVKEEANE